jgi:hypothetical protein
MCVGQLCQQISSGANSKEITQRDRSIYLSFDPLYFPTTLEKNKKKEIMSSDKRKKKLTNGGAGGDEAAVEELLRAAQDDVLLNLRLNSHSISDDSHFASLDPDLMRRFDALKSKPSVPASSNCDVDDLESRFAKLKGGVGSDHDIESGGSGGISEPGMEDEMEKVMQWAMDAARLDQSSGKSTGEDEVCEIVSAESSDEEESDDEDEKAEGKKTKAKAKGKKNKWFF